jgi:nitrogenase molybdenum-iron protein alpha/beta subunit
MPIRKPRETVEDFALKGMHLAKMTGVSLGVHAIPDAFLLMHSGVGCKYKTAAQIANHDWGSHPNRREAWTQVAELQLIQGSSVRIGPFARSWYQRRRPALMVTVSAYFIELTGEDFSDSVVAAEKTLPCDMALIPTAAPNGGFYEGYAAVMLQVAKRQDWKSPPTKEGTASAIGFFYSRYEPDEDANVDQLAKLTRVGGLELGPVLLSGKPYGELQEASQSPYVLQLPYARPIARKLRRLLKKRDVIELDLPLGLTATRRFVRTIAQRTGGDVERVTTWAEAQAEEVRKQLDKLRDHFRNLDVAVFADPPLAAGLVSMLADMGVRVRVVGLRDSHGALGGTAQFLEILARNGIEDVSDMEILPEPSLRRMRDVVMQHVRQGMRGILASSHEIELLQSSSGRVPGVTSDVFLIEVGFPSDRQHAAMATPTLGYAGLLTWAQRILDAARAPRMGAGAG